MTYLNQYHKESTERMLHKQAEWLKSPTCSEEAASTMKRNMAMGQRIEEAYMMSRKL